jgi:hypothetical protein
MLSLATLSTCDPATALPLRDTQSHNLKYAFYDMSLCMYVCKGWAIKLAPLPRPSKIHCATPTANPLLILHSI